MLQWALNLSIKKFRKKVPQACLVAVRQKVKYTVDSRPINTTSVHNCNNYFISFIYRPRQRFSQCFFSEKLFLVSVVVCEFLLYSFAQIKVRSTLIHFVCIAVIPAWQVEGEQLQCRQNGSNLIWSKVCRAKLKSGLNVLKVDIHFVHHGPRAIQL